MVPPDERERFITIAIVILVIMAPVLIIVITLSALVILGELALGRVTPLEFVELYIIDLVLFAGLAYVVYRLTLLLVETRNMSIDEPETTDTDESDGELEPSEDSW